MDTQDHQDASEVILPGDSEGSNGYHIEFSDVKFSVQTRGPEKQGERKYILKGITGMCQPGRLCAMMGSSGAGKTTLLDILACNMQSGGRVEGQILVNGQRRNAREFRRHSCYVLQTDVLLSSATVRESIATSAMLKLPATESIKTKMDKVDQVLKVLGLTEARNTLIGDELLGIKGISGGQKRRVSIGIELVKNPTAIFLDEPTSGLDSEIAASLIELLGQLCSKGRTVVLTIHQPNSLITSMFVDFILLADGKLVYGGPWGDAVSFFNRAGLTCPQYMNPSDFFLHALQDTSNIDKLVDEQSASKKLSVDVEMPYSSMNAEGGKVSPDEDEQKGSNKEAPGAPALFQIKVLAYRSLRTYLRNPIYLISETSQYAFMGLFVGLMYLQLNNSVETGVSDRLASIWFGMAVLSFTPSFSAVVAWDKDRILLRRETGQAMYTLWTWYVSKCAISIPLQCVQTLLFSAIAYFMVGYTITWSNVLIYYASYALFQITSESIGMMCAAVTKTAAYATLALTFLLLILLSFSGFLVSDVPVYFRWVSKISYLTYAFAAISISQFDSTEFVCTSGTNCVEGQTYQGSEVIPPGVDNGISPGINLVILLCITIGCRIITFLLIWGAQRIGFL